MLTSSQCTTGASRAQSEDVRKRLEAQARKRRRDEAEEEREVKRALREAGEPLIAAIDEEIKRHSDLDDKYYRKSVENKEDARRLAQLQREAVRRKESYFAQSKAERETLKRLREERARITKECCMRKRGERPEGFEPSEPAESTSLVIRLPAPPRAGPAGPASPPSPFLRPGEVEAREGSPRAAEEEERPTKRVRFAGLSVEVPPPPPLAQQASSPLPPTPPTPNRVAPTGFFAPISRSPSPAPRSPSPATPATPQYSPPSAGDAAPTEAPVGRSGGKNGLLGYLALSEEEQQRQRMQGPTPLTHASLVTLVVGDVGDDAALPPSQHYAGEVHTGLASRV